MRKGPATSSASALNPFEGQHDFDAKAPQIPASHSRRQHLTAAQYWNGPRWKTREYPQYSSTAPGDWSSASSRHGVMQATEPDPTASASTYDCYGGGGYYGQYQYQQQYQHQQQSMSSGSMRICEGATGCGNPSSGTAEQQRRQTRSGFDASGSGGHPKSMMVKHEMDAGDVDGDNFGSIFTKSLTSLYSQDVENAYAEQNDPDIMICEPPTPNAEEAPSYQRLGGSNMYNMNTNPNRGNYGYYDSNRNEGIPAADGSSQMDPKSFRYDRPSFDDMHLYAPNQSATVLTKSQQAKKRKMSMPNLSADGFPSGEARSKKHPKMLSFKGESKWTPNSCSFAFDQVVVKEEPPDDYPDEGGEPTTNNVGMTAPVGGKNPSTQSEHPKQAPRKRSPAATCFDRFDKSSSKTSKKVSPLSVYAKVQDSIVLSLKCRRYKKRTKSFTGKEDGHPMNKDEMENWKKTGTYPATEQAVRHVISELLERVSQCGDRHVSELPDFAEIGTHRVRELLYQFCQRYSLDCNDFDELDKVLKPSLVTKTDEPKTSERTIIRKRTSTSPAVKEEEEEVEEEEAKAEPEPKPPEPVKTPKAPAPVAKKATEPPERRVLRKLPGRKDRGRQKRKRGGKAPAFTRRYSTRSAKDSDNEEAANSEADIIIDSSSDNESGKEEEVICDTKRNNKKPTGNANRSTGNDGVSKQTKKQAQQETKTSKRKKFEKAKDLQEKPSTKEPPKRKWTRVNNKSGSDTSQSSASDEKSHSRKEENRDSSPSSLASNKSQVMGKNEKGKFSGVSDKSSLQKAPDKLPAKASEKSSSKSSEKFQVSKAAEKSQASKTSEKSHAVKASEKSQAAKASEKVQASKQPEKSQPLRGHEKAGTAKTSEKLKTAKPFDKSHISDESEKQRTAESSEKSHKINTSNKSLKVDKSDKSLKMTTTDKSLKIDTSEKSLKTETSDKSINIAASDISLEINSSDKSVEMSTLKKSLEINASEKSLKINTSEKSLKINTSEKSLKINTSAKSMNIEICEDSNKSSKSEKSLNTKTTEKLYKIDTSEKPCVDLSSTKSDAPEQDTEEPNVSQTSEITTVIDTLDRSIIPDVPNESLQKSEPLPITGDDVISEIDKGDEVQCVTPTVNLSEISQILEKKTRDSHVKGKSHGEQVSILAPMMRTHEKLRTSEVTEKAQITELCKQRLQTTTEHSEIELEPSKSQLTTLLKKQVDNSSNNKFDTSTSAGTADTFLRSDSHKMEVPPKCTIQRPIPIYRNRPPLDAVAVSPPFLRKMEISDPKLQIRGKLSNWRVSLEDIMAKDPLRSHAHLSPAKKISEEVPRYTSLNVPNPFEAQNLDGGKKDTGKRDLHPPRIDINSSENAPRGFTPPRTERKEFQGHPDDLQAEAFYNGPSPILSNELHKKDFLPYPPGTQRTTPSEFYQTPPKSIGSFGIFETGAFEAVSLTKKTFDGVRGSKSPAKEDESSSAAFETHEEVEEPIYLGKPPELVLVKDIKKEFMEEAKCADMSRRRSSSAGSKESDMPRIAHFAMKRERRKSSVKHRDPVKDGHGRSACSESDDSDGGLVIDLERGQALDDKSPGSVPKKEPKSEPTVAAPADLPVVPAAVKKEEEGGTSRAWDEEDDDCVILTEEAAAAKKSSSEKALKDDESILRTLLLETGEVLNGSSSSQDNVGPSSQQGDYSNSLPDIDSKTTIGQEVMKLLYQSYHDASNSSSSPGFSDDKKPIEKLSPGGCSPHEESISMEEDRTDWSTRDPRQLKEKIKKLKNEIVYLQCMADQKDKERTAIVCFKKYKEEVLRRLVKEYTYNVQGHFRDWIRSKHDKAENRSPSFRDSPPALRQQGPEPQASILQPRPAHSRPPLTMYHPVPKQEDQQPPATGSSGSSSRSPSQQPPTHYGVGGEKLPTVETLIAKATENYGVDMRTMRGSSSAAGSPPASAATQTILKKVLSSKESFSPTHSLSPSLMDSMRSKLATSQPLQLVNKPYPKQYDPVDLINKPPRSSADPSSTFNVKAIPKLYDTAKANAMYQYPPGFDSRPKSCKPYDVPKLLASCEYPSPFESRASSKPYDIPKPMGATKVDYPMVYEGSRTSSKAHDLPSKAKLEYPHVSYDHHRASSKSYVSKPGHPYEYPPTFDSRSSATSKSYEPATKPSSCDYSTLDATRSPHHQQSKSLKPGNDSYAKDRSKHTSHHPGSPSYWSIQTGAKVASDPGRPSDALKMERSNPVRAHSESSLGKRGPSGHAFSSQPLKLSSLMKPDSHHERSLKSSVERLYNRKSEEERRAMPFQPHPASPAQPVKGVGAAPPPFLPVTHLPQPLEPRGNPTCNRCGQPDATFLCSGCRKHWYCSPHCQTMLWPDHSRSCAGAINSTPPL